VRRQRAGPHHAQPKHTEHKPLKAKGSRQARGGAESDTRDVDEQRRDAKNAHESLDRRRKAGNFSITRVTDVSDHSRNSHEHTTKMRNAQGLVLAGVAPDGVLE